MRVSTNSYSNQLLGQLSALTARQSELQKQVSTGQKIEKPSDDPAAAARVRQMQADQRESVTLRKNFDRADASLKFTSNSANLLHDLSRQALSAVGLLTGADSQAELDRTASQVEDILDQALSAGNEKFYNEYIFAGDSPSVEPFTPTMVAGQVDSVTYNGGAGEMPYYVGVGSQINPTTSGTQNGEIATWMNHLIDLRKALEAGDRPAISAAAQALSVDDDNLLITVADLGSKTVRMNFVKEAEDSRFDALEDVISRETDVDLTQAVLQLNLTQTAYEAALQSAGNVLKLSLLDFI